MLTTPKEKEVLIIYLAAAKEAISAVLMTARDGKQVPLYFISRALQGPEVNFTPMEKLILALRFKFGEHDIQYRPRTSVKGQILVDFIVERPKDGTPDTPMEDREELPDPWILFTDGSSCVDGSEASLIIMNPEGMEFTHALRFRFNATINEAKYEALIAGLRMASQMGIQNLQENVDSKLVANQGKSNRRKKVLAVVEEKRHTWMTPIYEYMTEGVLPEEKKKARTVRCKAGRYVVISEVVMQHAFWTKIRGGKCFKVHHPVPKNPQEKMTPITSPWPFYKWGIDIAGPFSEGPGKVKFLIVAIDYFTKWIEAKPVASITGAQVKKFVWDNIVCRFKLPRERVVERANRSLGKGIKARLGEKNKNWVEEVSHVLWAHRTMIKSSNGETPFSLTYGTEAVIPAEIGMPTLRTTEVHVNKNNEALGISLDLLEEKREQAAIQEARSKARMKGYYNARVRSISFRPGDLVYRNNEASHMEGGEAKPVGSITGAQVKKFVWDNIVCRFGLPGEVISDNGKQFRDNPFKQWCEKLNIRQCFASVKHPQPNGLVERANRSLGKGIKARLGEKNKNWVEEVSHVLWAHRTMIKSSNGETPFSLTYGTEA
nr:hypothetical protein [Tanacetum cinerariifolium]